MRILDLRRLNWEHDKLDHEYYNKFRILDVEAGSINEEHLEEDEKDATIDHLSNAVKKEDEDDGDTESVVEVSGLDLKLSSDNPDILRKAALSLTGFFEHYIIPSSQ